MSETQQDAAELARKLEAISINPEPILTLEDDATRRRLGEAARKLSFALEAPGDTVWRLGNSPFELVMARIGVQMKIFEVISNEPEGSTLRNEEVARKTKIDPAVMKRLLRYYQSYGMVAQPKDDGYAASRITKNLASKLGHVGMCHFFDILSPAYMAFPQFLSKNGYQNVTDPSNCGWQIGHQTEDAPFQWLTQRPDLLNVFLTWLSLGHEGLRPFLDVVDMKELAKGADASTPIFVDIGGAVGHQCIAVKDKYPDLSGRIILEDLAHVLDQAKSNPLPSFDGIETEAYDFFKQEQPVKGARVYYMREVLHDWPDNKCKAILLSTRGAMTEDSVLLIDEMVLPERGAPWRAAALDMVMMSCLAAIERSEPEWRVLLDEAGFKIVDIRKYTDECNHSVIFAVPK